MWKNITLGVCAILIVVEGTIMLGALTKLSQQENLVSEALKRIGRCKDFEVNKNAFQK